MKPHCQKGFAPVVILVAILIPAFVIGGFFLYQYKYKKGDLILNSTPKEQPEQQKPADWQTFKFKFGQIAVSYPPNWFVKVNDKNSNTNQYIDFFPGKNKSVISGDYIITLRVNTINDYDRVEKGQLNYSLPGLGKEQNASFTQQYGLTAIKFTKDGVYYDLSMDINKSLSQKLDPGEVNDIFIKMAKSIYFFNELGTCDDPVLKPLYDFPSHFTLGNDHQSTGKDKVLNSNYALEQSYPTYTPGPEASFSASAIDYGSHRRFYVGYAKDGSPFQDEGLSKKVVPVKGNRNYATEFETEILNVNCPDQGIINNYYRPYFITEDQNEQFGIALYGYSSNPNQLWGVDKWDIDLLKKTRDTVYAKRGSSWQKYTANLYQVTY